MGVSLNQKVTGSQPTKLLFAVNCNNQNEKLKQIEHKTIEKHFWLMLE